MKNVIIILSCLAFLSCGKNIQSTQMPAVIVDNNCDSIIQSLIDSIRASAPVQSDFDDMFIDVPIVEVEQIVIDTNNVCNYYKITALEMAQKFNDVAQRLKLSEKETQYYKALASSRAKKIVNNYTVNSKNKNTQIGDQNVQQNKPKGPAQNGEGNVSQQSKKGENQAGDGNVNQDNKNAANQAGDGNSAPTDNRSKDRFWLGVLVASGVIIGIYIGWQIIKRYIPGFLPVRLLVGIISKFKL